MEPLIRPASPSEAVLLTEIAHAAKRDGDYPRRWMTHWRETLKITPTLIREQTVSAAEEDGIVQGFYTLVVGSETASLEHLGVRPNRIGKDLRRRLLRHAVQAARTSGVRSITVEPDPNAAGFYRRLSFRRIGSVQADVDGTPRRLPLLRLDLAGFRQREL